MSLSAQSLVTLDDVKAFIKSFNDEDDAVLEMLTDGVSARFSQFTQRTLMSAVYTSLELDGNGLSELTLPNWPVTTLTSVYVDDVLLVADEDYKVDLSQGRLIRLDAVWPDGIANIVVTYTAGYALAPVAPATNSVPSDLKMAALKQIATEYQRFTEKSFVDTSRSLAGQSVSILDKEFAFGVEDVLERHKRY